MNYFEELSRKTKIWTIADRIIGPYAEPTESISISYGDLRGALEEAARKGMDA